MVERLVALGKRQGKRLLIGDKTAVSSRRYRLRRYGVISEVLVKNKAAGTVNVVENESFKAKGGSCLRVVNVPRRTRYDIMRSTGEYQIACSKEDEMRLSITVPELFAAFPGDVAVLENDPTGMSGSFTVGRTRCFASALDMGTEIILSGREA